MKETNEFLAAMFAAYWGTVVAHPCDMCAFEYRGVRIISDVDPVRPRMWGDWSGGTNPNMSCESYADWVDCKLILTPLSEISDEDAIEVAKIMGWEGCDEERCWLGTAAVLHYFTDFSGWEDSEFDTAKNRNIVCYNYFVLSYIKIADFLRSKSYDCGFRQYTSLIAAGFATQKITL